MKQTELDKAIEALVNAAAWDARWGNGWGHL